MEILKLQKTARIIVIALLLTMIAWLLPPNMTEANAATKPKAPRVSSKGTVTWDCVYFGHYPQSSNGKEGFKNEPIKWRVLSVKGNNALLLADKSLDAQPYNRAEDEVTWEKSTIRSWLNGYDSSKNKKGTNYTSKNFIKKAFTAAEQKSIYKQTVLNAKNPEYGTAGGNNTKDKVFLLSIAEANASAYGFPGSKEKTNARKAKITAYTASKNSDMNESSTFGWQLRSPGGNPYLRAGVYDNGWLNFGGSSADDMDTVRPALHLNLSSNLWKHAKTAVVNVKPKQVSILSVSSQRSKTLDVQWLWEDNAALYQVMVATDEQFQKDKKTVNAKIYQLPGEYDATTHTLKGLKSGKTYYVKVRGYVKIGKYILYGPYSKARSAKVK